jgi:hypothetical protein
LRAVDTLSPANRDAVLLFYYQDLSLRETAAILGISVTALKGRLHRARQQLRDDLLSVYREERGDETMIPVKFANVIRVESNIIRDEQPQRWNILMLLDETERRVLPIWIAPGEADALVGGILWTMPNNRFKRPLTWNFVTSILDATGVTLEQVVISALRDEVFYATARIRSGDGVHEIDARPSDAIPLALVLDQPLYVSADEVAPETWWPVPDDFDIAASLLGVGTAGLQPEHFASEPIHLEHEASFTEAEWEQFDEQTKETHRQAHRRALREYVFSA